MRRAAALDRFRIAAAVMVVCIHTSPLLSYTEAGDSYSDGYVAFHNREGEHSPCRADWMEYIDFLLK